MRIIRVGFIIDSLVPGLGDCLQGRCSPRALLSGIPSDSSMGVMRFGWVAEWINNHPQSNLHYELYRPWRRYDVIVFLKSMGEQCRRICEKKSKSGVATIFDLNVDYFTQAEGVFYYEAMAPTEEQRKDAIQMTNACDALIADSRYVAKIARKHHPNVAFIPDNVREDLICHDIRWHPRAGEKLLLLWSGQIIKLFELLRIKNVLMEFAPHYHLRIITNGSEIPSAWHEPWRTEFSELIKRIPHEFIPFTSLEALAGIYDAGGVFLSPRFLNNTYNLGHTEWKIALAMARGRLVLCSEQPSYVEVSRRSNKKGIRICRTNEDWRKAFEDIFSGRIDWRTEQEAAADVIKRYYSTAVVAAQHVDFMKTVMQSC